MAQIAKTTIRWEPDLARALDAWCKRQTVRPSVAEAVREAVRRLIGIAEVTPAVPAILTAEEFESLFGDETPASEIAPAYERYAAQERGRACE